jgi:hypothetical protein
LNLRSEDVQTRICAMTAANKRKGDQLNRKRGLTEGNKNATQGTHGLRTCTKFDASNRQGSEGGVVYVYPKTAETE